MILIVGDDSEYRVRLTALLSAEGCRVKAVDSLESALASIPISKPTLIMLDTRIISVSGFEVCHLLKRNEETRDIPLLFFSLDAALSERPDAFRFGAIDFVNTPFQREELLLRVRTHRKLGRLRSQLAKEVADRTAELHESEERFRTMADAAPVMIVVSDTNKSCTFLNKPWQEFTGCMLEEVHGKSWFQVVHPDDLERCNALFSAAFDSRRSVDIEYRLRRSDGTYRWVLDRSVPRFTPDGLFKGYIGCCIDITDLKQNQDRMLAAQKLESLGVMAAGVAHDFGNLFYGIFAEADIALAEMPNEAAGRENVQKIASVATYATELVRMLMASAGSGSNSDALEGIDLSVLVEQTLRLLTVSISKRAVVRCDLAKGLPALQGNVPQIRQVVMNLVTNASEALNGNQGLITVMTQKTHIRPGANVALPDGDYIRLAVSDTGCGMSVETRAQIFDQFFTTKSLGRGLGLAAVRGIVRSHGGAINVTSTPGAGSTFEVFFPTCRRPKEKGVSPGRRGSVPASHNSPFGSLKPSR